MGTVTIEALAAELAATSARLAELEARVERLTARVLHGANGEPSKPAWNPNWAPPKDQRPRCGAPTSKGPCVAAAVWDRIKRAPLHGRCHRHAPPTEPPITPAKGEQ